MKTRKEFRDIVDLRAEFDEESSAKKISGYAAVFNERAEIAGLFTESIARGAFTKSLQERADIKALYNHDTSKVLGATKNGTLKLSEDDRGLRFELDPNLRTATGQEVYELIKRGDVDKMSFGFFIREDQWSIKDSTDHREILEADVFEVSVVPFPAYDGTSVSARSAEEAYKDFKEKKAKEEAEKKAAEEIKKKIQQDLKRRELDILKDRCL